MSQDTQAPTPVPPPRKRVVSGSTLGLVAVLVAAGAGYYFYVRAENAAPTVDEFGSLKTYLRQLGRNQKLDAEYADANGDMVADPPADAAKLLTVKEIAFSAIGTDDEKRLEREQADWKDLMAAISKATGLPVKYRTDLNGVSMQVEAMKAGTLHVTAFNTGAVAEAVNSAGFTPLFAQAGEDGRFGIRAEILVKAGSPIQKPEDLRGKTIGFVALSSNSGAKLPMSMLFEKHGMLPSRDYKYKITGDHVKSLLALADSAEFDAVCVASDLKDGAFAKPIPVGREKETRTLAAGQFRVIYASELVPPLCFGVPHRLPPELKAKVEAAFKNYRFPAGNPGKVKFTAVNYKDDWKIVREIDTALSRLADVP